MGLRREDGKKGWPPPPYYPGCTSITVVIHWGGECTNGPTAEYNGGQDVIYDHVNTKTFDFWELSHLLRNEVTFGEKAKYYVKEDNIFKLIEDDEHLKEVAGNYIYARVLDLYVVESVSDGETESESESAAAGEGGAAVEGERREVGGHGGAEVEEEGQFGDRGVVSQLENEEVAMDDMEWDFGWAEIEYNEDTVQVEVGMDEGMNEEFAGEDDEMDEDGPALVESDYEGAEEFEDEQDGAQPEDEGAEKAGVAAPGGTGHGIPVGEQSDGDNSDNDVVTTRPDFSELVPSDEEDNEGRQYPVFNPSEVYNPHITIEMLFGSKDELKQAVRSIAVRDRRQIKITKTTPTRVYAKCLGKDCDWKLCAHKVKNESNLQVTRYVSTHNCEETYDVPAVNSRWLSEKYLHRFISDPKRSAEGFRLDVVQELKINVTRHQAMNAKKRALQALNGSSEYQFSRLWDYAEELKKRNPGSTVLLGTTGDGGQTRFDRFYVCLAALKKGWRLACRPLIGVDGCHLSGPHKGVLLTAVGVDPNNALYPIAYAIVPIENSDNWGWFLGILKEDLQLDHVKYLTFTSDRQKGLIHAMQEVFPGVDHRFCVRHMHGNFCKAGYRGLALKNLLWSAARAATVPEFINQMKKIREYSEGAWKWLGEREATQWTKSHFSEGPMCDMLLNNLCESFNSCIKEAREKTILTSLERIREYIMKRHCDNFDRASIKWANLTICPQISKIIRKNARNIGNCIPIKSSHRHYQITMMDGNGQYVVDLIKRECSCRLWQLNGYPCVHGLAAIFKQGNEPEDYVEDCYKVSCYKKAYQHPIIGISSDLFWQKTAYIPPQPPRYARGVGRPPKARRLGPDEPKKKQRPKRRYTTDPTKMTKRQFGCHCSNCGQPGHKITTCPTKGMRQQGHDGAGTSTTAAGPSSDVQQAGDTSNPSPPPEITKQPTLLPPNSPIAANEDEEHGEPVITQENFMIPQQLVPGPSINQQLLGLGPLERRTPHAFTGAPWRAPQFSIGNTGPPVSNIATHKKKGKKK